MHTEPAKTPTLLDEPGRKSAEEDALSSWGLRGCLMGTWLVTYRRMLTQGKKLIADSVPPSFRRVLTLRLDVGLQVTGYPRSSCYNFLLTHGKHLSLPRAPL